MADLVQYYGTGRRKSAIARVFLRPGTGEWKVNGKAFDVYFVTEQQRVAAKRTLALVELASSFDVVTTVKKRRRSRAGRRSQAGRSPRAGSVQSRVAQGAEGRRPADTRLAHEGTQEVRAEGRSCKVPVQQALKRLQGTGFRFQGSVGSYCFLTPDYCSLTPCFTHFPQ